MGMRGLCVKCRVSDGVLNDPGMTSIGWNGTEIMAGKHKIFPFFPFFVDVFLFYAYSVFVS